MVTGAWTWSLTRSCPQGDARMGKVRRRRFLNRGLLWLHARVIPVAVNLCHFWKGVNAELDLEGTWIRASRGSWDHRELTAAINLGNLVIPYQASGPTPDGCEAAAG